MRKKPIELRTIVSNLVSRHRTHTFPNVGKRSKRKGLKGGALSLKPLDLINEIINMTDIDELQLLNLSDLEPSLNLSKKYCISYSKWAGAINKPTDNNRTTSNSTINKWFEDSYSKKHVKPLKI